MRLCVCDYSGHPFQAQLSRELARRKHDVLHLSFAEFQTPKGRLAVEDSDPKTLAIEAVSLGHPFAKHGFVKRRFQEIEVGRRIAARIASFAPDVVIGSNLPLDALDIVVRSCVSAKQRFVFWQQDIYSAAITKILTKKFGPIGRVIGAYYRSLERRAAVRSAAIVIIAEDFRTTLQSEFKIAGDKIHTIENWAPLDEIVPRPKVNAWSTAHGLADSDVVLYTGTIGLKHDPSLILALAEALRDRPKTRVVVASEGPAASWLKDRAAERSLDTLKVLPFQPFGVYSDVLGASDVLISILEPDAGIFSVPSKVLSYLCAARAIVLSAPPENLAAKIVTRSGAGICTPAGNQAAFVGAVETLLKNRQMRTDCGANGRIYAERTFDIGAIADRFESILGAIFCEAQAGREGIGRSAAVGHLGGARQEL